MYTPSKAFLERTDSEPFVVWVVGSHGSVAVDDCSVTRSWCGSQFTLGSACAGEFKATVQRDDLPFAKGEQVKLEIGLNGVKEREPMGTFTLTTLRREIDDDRYTLTGRDAIGEALEGFYGGSETVKAATVLEEICRRCGFAVPQVTLPEDAMLTVEEKTMRALLAEIALLCGCNAGIDRFGALQLRGWSGDSCPLGVEDYYQSKLRVNEEDYVLGLLEVKDGEKTYSDQLEGLTQGLKLQGCMTQEAFDQLWSKWKNTTFRPGQVELPEGIWLDPGDWLRITDSRGQTYTMPVLEVTHTFDGGFRSQVKANVSESKAGNSQTVSQAVNGLKVEVGRFQKIYTEKLEATSAAVDQLQTEVLQARTILVQKPDGEVILRADADTGELVATTGTVGGMTMSSHALSAEVRYDYPKFTQADLDRAEQGVVGAVILTEEEIEKYDVNMDGEVSPIDLLAIQKMLHGMVPPYSIYRLSIDPTHPKACLQVEVIEGYHAGWRTELGLNVARMRNLTVAGQMSVQGRIMADFVVRNGFNRHWCWRLWNSGVAECWGTYTYPPVPLEAWGSMYASVEGGIRPAKYPISFLEKPFCTMSLEDASLDCMLYVAAAEGYDKTLYTPAFQLMRPTLPPSGVIQPTVTYHAVGRWE